MSNPMFFSRKKCQECRYDEHGEAELVRFTDDMVFAFERQSDAKRFYEVLPKRLKKAGLEMHLDKSQLIPAGRLVASQAKQQGKRLPTFNFLGFTGYWSMSRKGFMRLHYTSRKDRFSSKLKAMRCYLRQHLNTRGTSLVVKKVIQVIKGWINYHAISDNGRRVSQFIDRAKALLHFWLNRRGGNRRITFEKMARALKAMGFPTTWKIKSMF